MWSISDSQPAVVNACFRESFEPGSGEVEQIGNGQALLKVFGNPSPRFVQPVSRSI
jgi:hypothetical protein